MSFWSTTRDTLSGSTQAAAAQVIPIIIVLAVPVLVYAYQQYAPTAPADNTLAYAQYQQNQQTIAAETALAESRVQAARAELAYQQAELARIANGQPAVARRAEPAQTWSLATPSSNISYAQPYELANAQPAGQLDPFVSASAEKLSLSAEKLPQSADKLPATENRLPANENPFTRVTAVEASTQGVQ